MNSCALNGVVFLFIDLYIHISVFHANSLRRPRSHRRSISGLSPAIASGPVLSFSEIVTLFYGFEFLNKAK